MRACARAVEDKALESISRVIGFNFVPRASESTKNTHLGWRRRRRRLSECLGEKKKRRLLIRRGYRLDFSFIFGWMYIVCTRDYGLFNGNYRCIDCRNKCIIWFFKTSNISGGSLESDTGIYPFVSRCCGYFLRITMPSIKRALFWYKCSVRKHKPNIWNSIYRGSCVRRGKDKNMIALMESRGLGRTTTCVFQGNPFSMAHMGLRQIEVILYI